MCDWMSDEGKTADTPLGLLPFKGNLEAPSQGRGNLDPGKVFTQNLRTLYRPSCETKTGAGRGNFGNESWYVYK